jgi:hypothetical protein
MLDGSWWGRLAWLAAPSRGRERLPILGRLGECFVLAWRRFEMFFLLFENGGIFFSVDVWGISGEFEIFYEQIGWYYLS